MRKRSSDYVKVYYPKISRGHVIELIKKRVDKVLKSGLPLRAIVLFGSYAKKRYTVASDVDLLVVYEDLKREEDYDICWTAFDIPLLELHIFTNSQYQKMKSSNNSFMKDVERDGILIWSNL